MKQLLTLLLLFIYSHSQDLDALYKQAQVLEEQGKYKEAMLLYKQLAQKEKGINEVFVDQDKKKEMEVISETFDPIEDKETSQTLEQILASSFDIYPHRENYFFPYSYDTKNRADRGQTETKFQLSIKKPIAYNLLGFNETINFGYTHTSWWQLYEESSPFRETNYKPEVFITFPYGKKDKTALKGFTFGFLHESNGQPQAFSRSWNRIYFESYFQAKNFFIVPRVWYRIPEKEKDDDNPDLEDYLGYGDLTLFFPYKTHTFKLMLRDNLKFDDDNKGFVQLDWTFPFFNSKHTFGYIQLSSGYGDSLIDYDQEINRISFGISLSR